MIHDLFVNDLIEWIDESGNNFIERVLWIDEGYIIAFVYDINAKTGFPEAKKVSEIREAISDGHALKLKSDPWARIVRDEDLSPKEKKLRDRAWQIISFIVTQEPSIYYRDYRGTLVQQVLEKYNAGRTEGELVPITVYKYLRRFWQRGKNKNALLPDYANSGGKGKPKISGDKKRGRPRKYAQVPEIGIGRNVTEEDKRIFRFAIAKFYNNSKKNFLTTAYDLMIKEYYSEDFYYDENGVKKCILIPPDKRPTFTQFKYWYEVEQTDIRKTIISRKGSRKYALENRAITGTSQMETIGPGSRYQIDATIADVYLVSIYNPNWIIGRPVIYVVIDVFSRMITGVYVGLEGPSWTGAMMALANAAADKVKFCQEYGIEISEDEWPCRHIPDAILGDRGELAGMNVETLIPNLDVRIENAAPYRADWKGLVERQFRTIHGYVKPFVPGYIDTDFRQRGGHDYRLDGRLNINEFTKIVIFLILQHNNHDYLNNYARDEMMITDDVNPIPRELWQWGIANRSGRLRTFPEDIVKLNLMPTGKATVTARGIKFKGMYYTCEKARKEFWFEKSRSSLLSKSEKSLDISYDIRQPNFIYLRSPNGRDFEKCWLLESQQRYLDKNFYDIDYLLAYEKLQSQKNQGTRLQAKADLIANIESIVSQAKEETKAVLDDTLSDRQKVSGIRQNRADEKNNRRKNESFELTKAETPNADNAKNQISTQTEDSEDSKLLQPDHMDLLKRKRKERKRGQE
ncbi:DDE-type integrase/transposase/recombinase [Nostoc sp. FACHB-152]|uniref:Mu transposase C-terminal domain-containing protein n=1 Tax=unclassified Nostoc TaxID=2593658 RepID=UPI001687725A|nr:MULTISPECIES: Mu transposase C-terminal domain-containing protein [unclassified Nostoc]MBD2451000.1 DDE-type integrase/transposase/recombinase [Nostoc sp. FACHB-152]MBD2471057.1 DDE-type integrase/transposase/recombinase [Nostoc sp. FACHB-145]